MKITSISAYAVELSLKEGSYSWGTQSFPAFDSTIVVVDTDEGIQGFGEICPLGPGYMPSFAEGARAGMQAIAPTLIGLDPRQLDVVSGQMDIALKGHPYAKSGLDMAMWDVAAKAAGVPVSTLLGGRLRDQVKLFRVISRSAPEEMAERLIEYRGEGFTQYQMRSANASTPTLPASRPSPTLSSTPRRWPPMQTPGGDSTRPCESHMPLPTARSISNSHASPTRNALRCGLICNAQ